ncbi:MAG: hypothetical protein K6G83_03360 [Lachnospiraceae bacterium]|nr:hypothetical protein [Lachnospiraceae bacterium]
MDLIASFNSQKVGRFHFFLLHGLKKNDDLLFLFDTGAACPVIGVNNFFDKDEDNQIQKAFRHFLLSEVSSQGIISRPMKTANSQEVMTYPCLCHNVTIENSSKVEFYFDISFAEISIPLLGSSFIDDCSYSHIIDGNLNITGMKNNAGAKYYEGTKVLDFDTVVEKFESLN